MSNKLLNPTRHFFFKQIEIPIGKNKSNQLLNTCIAHISLFNNKVTYFVL